MQFALKYANAPYQRVCPVRGFEDFDVFWPAHPQDYEKVRSLLFYKLPIAGLTQSELWQALNSVYRAPTNTSLDPPTFTFPYRSCVTCHCEMRGGAESRSKLSCLLKLLLEFSIDAQIWHRVSISLGVGYDKQERDLAYLRSPSGKQLRKDIHALGENEAIYVKMTLDLGRMVHAAAEERAKEQELEYLVSKVRKRRAVSVISNAWLHCMYAPGGKGYEQSRLRFQACLW